MSHRVVITIATALLLLATGIASSQQAGSAVSVVPDNLAPHPAPVQPLPYSHKTHVGMGMQCRQCHANPAPGGEMTFPSTAACMNCHATLDSDRPAIRALAAYARAKQPIPWVRVYKVLPGVTWTHRRHLDAAVPCDTCHGAVASLEAMTATTAVTAMAVCMNCHQARGASVACAVCHAWPKGSS